MTTPTRDPLVDPRQGDVIDYFSGGRYHAEVLTRARGYVRYEKRDPSKNNRLVALLRCRIGEWRDRMALAFVVSVAPYPKAVTK